MNNENGIWFKSQNGESLYCTNCLEIQPCNNPMFGEGYVIVTFISGEPEYGNTIIGSYKTETEARKELDRIEQIIAENYTVIQVK